MMRSWTLLLVCAVLLVLGQAHGKGRDPTKEEDCCTALLVEGEEGSLDAAGKYVLPTICRGEPAPAMACPQLWFQSPAISDNDIGEPARLAFQQQSDLRADESCSPLEWEQRCPPGATMLLSKKRGGCRAAGCVAAAMEGELTAQLIDVDEKRFTRKLTKAMKSSPPSDIELVRALVDEATTKGFRSAAMDEATKAVTRHDDQAKAFAVLRSLPGALARQVSKSSLAVARHSKKQRKKILALQLTNNKVLSTAASDKERSARTEGDLLAKLDTAEDTIAFLTDTVAEQQLAAAMESERFDQALRQLDNELKTSRRAARAELEFCERDLAEVDSASVSLSRFTVEKTHHEDPLAPMTCPVTEVAALGMHDRSAAHEAAQWTCARLHAVQRMVDASTSRWEDDKATYQLQEAEGRDREVELNRLLDAGEKMRKDLEDDLALSEEELDETQTELDACAADIEDISSRSVDLVRTLQEDVAKTAVRVGGLASAAPEAEDLDGSDYDMIRTRLEAVQRLVLTATSTLEAEIFTCQGEKADAGDREAEIEEQRQELEDELAVCEEELDETQTAADSCAADFEDISSRSVDLVRTLQEDAAKMAVRVGGLAPEAEDRIGSDYDMIRARLESAQQLALTVTSTLEEDIFTCQGEKADAVDREVKTGENMRKLNEDLSDCANYLTVRGHAGNGRCRGVQPVQLHGRGGASVGNGRISVSDSSGDVNDTGVDVGEDSTASAGDGTAVHRTEADDAGNEEDVEGEEPDAHVIDANPLTLDGV
ncbi:hypothetical protein Esi_0506_0016 [Ectocarpus siliculosus]|uniref:Uncharacterized protein n=1 Tax=Ectocarpus siliculosus TaxID=2880 RepID=D7G3D5_ECTSI|nr:hypothetical protein Esi_0506_0016 [Ectocarpus siliculosus]|eukprot:CBJ33529.1 hypothetical protein Esi_0506_0016 [Ectocarpus siliculosus]